MKNNNKTFPYPVLTKNNDDILESYLNFKYIPIESKNLKCSVKIELKNETLEKLIEEKKAIFIIHVECSKTRYRKIIKSFEYDFEFEINNKLLLNKVEISSMIISTENLDYKNSLFNEDFIGDSYFIDKNKILAYDDDIIIDIERNTDSLENFPSIFAIVLNNDDDKKIGMDLDLAGNKIKIILNHENYEMYKILREDQRLEQVLASMFIIPSLVNVLTDFENLEESSNLNWYHSINSRLKELGITNAEEVSKGALKFSQLILGNTFKNSLETLKEISLG